MITVLRSGVEFSFRHRAIRALWVGVVGIAIAGAGQAQTVTLVGASQFNENHPVTRTLLEFERLVTECYSGDVTFDLHLNSELGLEKDYFENMSQGIAVDYAVVSPAAMSTYSQTAPLMDMPFLFFSHNHFIEAISAGAFDPIAEDILEQNNVRIIGYAGGSTRNIISRNSLTNLEQLRGLSIRITGWPFTRNVFAALGTIPISIPYNQLYESIHEQTIQAADIELSAIDYPNIYETAPHLLLTRHAFKTRPIAFSGSRYEILEEKLQGCILEAGEAAGEFGRELEISYEANMIRLLEGNRSITIHELSETERERMFEIAGPAKESTFYEIAPRHIIQICAWPFWPC